MKMFLIFWLCVQNPTTSLEETCARKIMYETSYNTKEECRKASKILAQEYMDIPNVYITTFCTSKIVTNT